jgi:hypothetical protein
MKCGHFLVNGRKRLPNYVVANVGSRKFIYFLYTYILYIYILRAAFHIFFFFFFVSSWSGGLSQGCTAAFGTSTTIGETGTGKSATSAILLFRRIFPTVYPRFPALSAFLPVFYYNFRAKLNPALSYHTV